MKPVYVTCMGDIYRLSRTGYRNYLKRLAETGSADLNDFGAVFVSKVYNVTDITRDDAELIVSGGRCSWLPTGRD